MAPFRLQDRWLALGLIAVIYVGGRIISWQIREAERIGIEDKAIRDEEEQNEQLKRKKKGKGEDGMLFFPYNVRREHYLNWRFIQTSH